MGEKKIVITRDLLKKPTAVQKAVDAEALPAYDVLESLGLDFTQLRQNGKDGFRSVFFSAASVLIYLIPDDSAQIIPFPFHKTSVLSSKPYFRKKQIPFCCSTLPFFRPLKLSDKYCQLRFPTTLFPMLSAARFRSPCFAPVF